MNPLLRIFGITDYIRSIALNASIVAQNGLLKFVVRGIDIILRRYQSDKDLFLPKKDYKEVNFFKFSSFSYLI
ncbi:MAG: hypothetical protein P8Y23_00985 [Candidatus Lokiarchaeota archaeon]|jgi:hypothetical protein